MAGVTWSEERLSAQVVNDVLAVDGPVELDDVDVVGGANGQVEIFDMHLAVDPLNPMT